MTVIDGFLIFTCVDSSKTYKKILMKIYQRDSKNTYQFCGGDLEKFGLVLQKGVWLYDYLDGWERFKKKLLPCKKKIYNNLATESIIDFCYKNAKRVSEASELENLSQYLDLYVQSDTLVLADVFGSFRNKCVDIYELDPAHFVSAPRLAYQASMKETKVKLKLLTNADMLLVVGNCIKGGKRHAAHRYPKADTKGMKEFDPSTESP